MSHLFKKQFTGRLDLSGDKIYEGDIVRIGDEVGYVIYEEVHCAFLVKRVNTGVCKFLGVCASEIVTIGNIYDNPELIEEYKKFYKEEGH